MAVDDLAALIDLQEEGAVAGLGHIFPQETHAFPRDRVLARWRTEIADPAINAYVATVDEGPLVGFAARRSDELLHFGTAVETWGSGLAGWVHDQLVASYPDGLEVLRLRVFAENARAIRFYEKLGWLPTGRESRTSFPPHPLLVEYTLERPTR